MKESAFAKKPSHEKRDAADAWVAAGREELILPKEEKKQEEPPKKLLIEISRELHNKLKLHCVSNHMSIKSYITGLIEKDLC